MTGLPSVSRSILSIFLAVALLVGVLFGAAQLFGQEVAILFGMALTGVAPKLVDTIHNLLPHTGHRIKGLASRLRLFVPVLTSVRNRLVPAIPAQRRDIAWWSVVAAIVLFQSYDVLTDLLILVIEWQFPDEVGPVSPIWLVPFAFSLYVGLAAAGYIIGRLDPDRMTKNLGAAFYVYILMMIPAVTDPALMSDMGEMFSLAEDLDRDFTLPRVLTIALIGAETAVRAALAFYAALWGARHGLMGRFASEATGAPVMGKTAA